MTKITPLHHQWGFFLPSICSLRETWVRCASVCMTAKLITPVSV